MCIQWNLAIPATLGTCKSGWISEVAGSQGTSLIQPYYDMAELAGLARRAREIINGAAFGAGRACN